MTKTRMLLWMKRCSVIKHSRCYHTSQEKLLLAGWAALCSFQALPYPLLQCPQPSLSSFLSFSRPSTCPQGPSSPYHTVTSLPTFFIFRSCHTHGPLELPLLAPLTSIVSPDCVSVPPCACFRVSASRPCVCLLTPEHGSARRTGSGMLLCEMLQSNESAVEINGAPTVWQALYGTLETLR